MFGIGFSELIVIAVVALLIIDIRKLPKIARLLGKALKEFNKARESLDESDDKKLAG